MRSRAILRIASTSSMLLASALPAQSPLHGIFVKPLYNDKTNYSTRGAAGAKETTLYMMQPRRYMTGIHDTIGFEVTLQDEEAVTQENVEFSVVKYAANGVDPGATVLKASFRLFGFGLKGVQAFNFRLTLGFPKPIGEPNFGFGIKLPPNTLWPKDGVSIHSQLNIAKDSRRSRVHAPFDQQVWAFEQPNGMTRPLPFGGRKMDILQLTGLYIEPVIQAFVRSSAYGLGVEDLFGPESMHPLASRRDRIGYKLDGGQLGTGGLGLVYLSPTLSTNPVPLPRAFFHLSITPAWPLLIFIANLDGLGRGATPVVPFSMFPPGFRSFWLQAVILNPGTMETEVTEAIGVQGS
ncbi:MAG: hypothetical protein ACE5F1_20480 [Planctomycetota bacterium]